MSKVARLTHALARRAAIAVGLATSLGGAQAADVPSGTIAHGRFEIVAGTRRISTGSFPNQGGNPFATRAVSEFQLRWNGRPVTHGNGRYWRVLRLAGAPRPALLLVTAGFVLATEDAAGQLELRPLRSESASLAEVQWLDERNGQPGPSETYGIEAIKDLQRDTQLQGGRWLRLGSRTVLDVATLTAYPIEPWVPILPGVPVTSVSRAGDDVRAFSPQQTHYVLAGSGIDYTRSDQGTAWGLLVVDIAAGTASELRFDRRRLRFANAQDIDAAWIAHHFAWVRDAAGRDRLQLRERFSPWPWRARLWQPGQDRWQLDVRRIDAAFLPVLRALVQAEPGVQVAGDAARDRDGFQLTLGGCPLQARAFGDSSNADGQVVSVWLRSEPPVAVAPAVCLEALRRLQVIVDAELASGRHDALLKLD